MGHVMAKGIRCQTNIIGGVDLSLLYLTHSHYNVFNLFMRAESYDLITLSG